MKILKVVGIVAGVHALALLVIFASPGCSSSKAQSMAPAPSSPADAPAPVAAPPDISLPAPAPVPASDTAAPASGILYSPTRPGTSAAAALETQPVTGGTPATTYTVVSRDNLSTIAKKNHLKVSELAGANNLRAGSPLHVGQKLIIPTKASSGPAAASSGPGAAPASAAPAAAPAAGPAKPSGESVKYTVKSGETLSAIAHKYGVRMGDIATANSISDPQKIHAGQELVIPGGSVRKSGAAKAARSTSAASAAAPAPSAPPAPAPAAAPATDAASAPAPAVSDVPVIKIDDTPPAPAPKP